MGRHDRLFKELFETFFGDLLSLVVPGLRPKLEPEKAKFLRKEMIVDGPEGKTRQVDLLAEVPTRSGRDPQYVLVHVEVEAQARETMAQRMWRYAKMIWLRHDKPLIPIVVYLRGGKPGITRETVRGMLWDREIFRFHYYAFGLSGSDAEKYLERDEPLAWALASLMKRAQGTAARHKLQSLRQVAEASLQDAEKYLLAYCVEDHLQLEADERKEYEGMLAQIEEQGLPEVESVTDYLKRVRREGEKKGRRSGLRQGEKKGRREGRREGRQEGLRRSILKVLDRRFGEVPAGVHRKLETVKRLEDLDVLLTRALEVESVGELV